jgi:hypothetical protein
VWQVSPHFLATAHAVCDKSSHPSDPECLISQMAKHGAPAAAVGFTRELYKQVDEQGADANADSETNQRG